MHGFIPSWSFQALRAERQGGQGAEDIGKGITEVMSMKSQLDKKGSDDSRAL